MKIEYKPAYPQPDPASATGLHKVTGASTTGATAQTGADRVTLSGDALRIDATLRANGHAPGFDSQRVSDLKQAIAAGTYSIDPARIAHKLRILGI